MRAATRFSKPPTAQLLCNRGNRHRCCGGGRSPSADQPATDSEPKNVRARRCLPGSRPDRRRLKEAPHRRKNGGVGYRQHWGGPGWVEVPAPFSKGQSQNRPFSRCYSPSPATTIHRRKRNEKGALVGLEVQAPSPPAGHAHRNRASRPLHGLWGRGASTCEPFGSDAGPPERSGRRTEANYPSCCRKVSRGPESDGSGPLLTLIHPILRR